ncbi:MAG: peptidoglycan DD-metalloendopeptidase family protein [Desulfomonilaceae bacterium]
MSGKFYPLICLCVFWAASCSSTEAINKKAPVSCGFDPQFLARSSDGTVKTKRPLARLASLVSESCERGALASFFNSQARLASASNCNLPTRELMFPLKTGVLSSPFGYKRGRYHAGVDITAKRGDPVFACADGVVTAAGRQHNFGGLGILVTLDHCKGISTDYAHLSKVVVQPGQKVRQGQKIGFIGSTGRASCPHLHLQVRNGLQFYDPMIFFNQSQLSGIGVADSFFAPERDRLPRLRNRFAHAR